MRQVSIASPSVRMAAMLASGSRSSAVRLWDTVTGVHKRSLDHDLSQTNSVVFSPDGSMLASANDHHTIHLWDPKTGARLRTLQNDNGRDYSIAFSPDGSVLASWNDDTIIQLWNPKTGAQLRTLHWDPLGRPSHRVQTGCQLDPRVQSRWRNTGKWK